MMQKITPNSFIFFHSFIFVFFFLGLQLANAQVDLATWSLSNDGIPVNVQPEVNAAEFGFSSGLTNQQFAPGFGAAATSWSVNDGLTEYYQIAISPQPGDNLNIQNLSFSHSEIDQLLFFGIIRVGGPQRFSVRYSKDPDFSTFTTLINRGNTGVNVAESRSINQTVADGETLYIRFYGTNSDSFNFIGTRLTGFWVIDENTLRITGTVERCGATTTWTSSGWNNGAPNLNTRVNLNANYSTLTNGQFQACDLDVSPARILTVASGHTVTVKEYVSVSPTGNIVIEDGGSLLQIKDKAVNTGNISVLRNTTPVTKFDFTYWASPVSGNQLRQLSPNTLRDKYFSFNTNTQNWQIEWDGNTVMQPGIGYAVRSPQNFSTTVANTFVGNMVGVPNNGVIEVSVNAPNPGSVALIGNPYPSAINADAFILQNSSVLAGGLYFWTHSTPINNLIYNANDYAVYTLFGGTGTNGSPIPDGNIASGQGFFVDITQPGTVTFNNAMRIAGNNDRFFRSNKPDFGLVSLQAKETQTATGAVTSATSAQEKNRLWLSVTNTQGAFSQTLVGFADAATDLRDPLWDAGFLDGLANVVGFYSLLDDQKLAIQAKSIPEDLNNQNFVMGFRSNISGEFTLNIDQLDGLFNDTQKILLIDQLTNTTHDLKTGSYTFSTEKGVFDNRFIIQFANETLSLEDELTNTGQVLNLMSSGSNMVLESSQENIQSVAVFDLTGRRLYQNLKVNNRRLDINSLQRGVLLVQVSYENGLKETRKVSF